MAGVKLWVGAPPSPEILRGSKYFVYPPLSTYDFKLPTLKALANLKRGGREINPVNGRSRNRAHRFVVGLGVQPEAQARCGSARTSGALLCLSFGNDRHLL
jgi:hypothetical protein